MTPRPPIESACGRCRQRTQLLTLFLSQCRRSFLHRGGTTLRRPLLTLWGSDHDSESDKETRAPAERV